MHNQKGFSLVELAVSVIVIGLLLALVSKGGEMLDNARVASTATQIKAMEAGIDGFRTEFKAWPGDFDNARNAIARCGAVSAGVCSGGNGDGVTVFLFGGNPGNNSPMQQAAMVLSFRHLALSGYGAGIPSGLNAPNPRASVYGQTLPAAPVGGGFEFYYDTQIAGVTSPRPGHFFRLAGAISNVNLVPGQGIDGFAALGIDRKLDDGNMGAGEIVSTNIAGGVCDANSVANCLLFSRYPD